MPAQGLNARVANLQHLGRAEHFDSEGGGRITRVVYCEPYTAHKRVVTALKGTVYTADGGATYQRAKPHADPLYPWFYAADVQVDPAFPGAVRASRPTNFHPEDNFPGPFDQFQPIRTGLNMMEDLDGAQFLDQLTEAEIRVGQRWDTPQEDTLALNTGESMPIHSYVSRGACGAKITATYLPLIFQPGLTSQDAHPPNQAADPFDFVDPQWEPLTVTTQTGRSLFLLAPTAGNPAIGHSLHSGLSDTFAKPEIIWRFSIRRLMVPFLPQITLGLFANKINFMEFRLGNLVCPPKTVRMETPEVISKRAPDGQLFWDIKLKFLVRRLWDERYDHLQALFLMGWVDWNHAFGTPAVSTLDVLAAPPGVNGASYYPVRWKSGLWQLFGQTHQLFLEDQIMAAMMPPDLNANLHLAPFQAGFRLGQ